MIINIDCGDFYMPYMDNVYAYWQHFDQDYQSCHAIHFNRSDLPHDRNILITQNLRQLACDQIDRYDVAIFDNGMEALGSGTIGLEQFIESHKVRTLTGSKLHPSHPLNEKNIWYPVHMLVKQGHSGNFFDSNFPHYYDLIDLRKKNTLKTQGMIFVNGQNRSWRNFLIEIIRDAVPDLSVHNSWASQVKATNDCAFESEADCHFRETVNDRYRKQFSDDQGYYSPVDVIGIDGKFGQASRNLELIKAYSQFRCVLFPETSWQNNDMLITEKTVKCFVTHCIPWPIGGMHLHAQMLEVGFHTAWQLLPESLQFFDGIEDHQERHKQMAVAIKWLFDNQHVLYGPEADDLTAKNFYNWHCFTAANDAMEKLSNVIIGHAE